MSHGRAVFACLGFTLGLIGTSAGAAAQPPDDTARLVESLLLGTEAAAQRPFDPAFRAAAARALAALPPEELEARASRGGGIAPLALGDSSEKLVYTPVAPCRLIDTRLAGGSLAAGTVRDFKVTGAGLQTQGGNPAGCGVPTGPATAAVINFVAVNPVGPGNLRAWAYSTPPVPAPNASILNYAAVSGLNIANGIVVPICDSTLTTCPGLDLRAQADTSGTHLVADVVGYFERFPKEQVRSFTVRGSTGSQTTIASACTHVTGAEVTIAIPVAGRVTVRAVAPITIGHLAGIDDVLQAGIGQTAADCAFSNQGIGRFSVPANIPSANWDATVSALGVFDVAAGSYTFYLNAAMPFGGQANDIVIGQQSGMEATFHPN